MNYVKTKSGGCNQTRCFNDFWALNLDSRTWTLLGPYEESMSGGDKNEENQTDAWPSSRRDHKMAVWDDLVFISGGKAMGSSYPSDAYMICKLSTLIQIPSWHFEPTRHFFLLLAKEISSQVNAIKFMRGSKPCNGTIYTFGYGKHGQVCKLVLQ